MGCGSSSLKGEKVGDVHGEGAGPPAKKVRTNFSDVNFSTGAQADRRGTMAVAPDETRRPTTLSEEQAPDVPNAQAGAGVSSERPREEQDGIKLEAYKTPDHDPDSLAGPPPKPTVT